MIGKSEPREQGTANGDERRAMSAEPWGGQTRGSEVRVG